jgi:pyruvate/2-oxoglutarate dehydrogenase complex dihydrolipoamide acyltransferase (E2) component
MAAKKPTSNARARRLPAAKASPVVVNASPAAAKLAAANTIDVAKVAGSGRNGRVVVADVVAAIEAAAVGNGLVLVSVFGPFAGRVLLETSAERAVELLGQPLAGSLGPTRVVDATLREIAAFEQRTPGVGSSTLAATAVALAYELDNPFNSATSKSMCARSLAEVFDRLGARSPEPPKTSGLDEIRRRRDEAVSRR